METLSLLLVPTSAEVEMPLRSFLSVCLLSLLTVIALSFEPAIDAKHAHQASQGQSTNEQGFGEIKGRVINAQGEPVYGAEVYAHSMPLRMGAPSGARSDKNGTFTIRHLRVGRYRISVVKEEARYGWTFSRFYAAGLVQLPEVMVYEGGTVSAGDVRLGPRAGKLVGTLRDAKTRKGIVSLPSPEQARHLILCRLDDPKNCSEASPDKNGHFEILVPPLPVTIEATAPGYEKKDLATLHLKSGEIRRLDILLTPGK